MPLELLEIESRGLMEEMLQSLGRIMHAKKTALLVDDVVSNYLQSTMKRTRVPADELIQWSGNLILATEVCLTTNRYYWGA